jgi:hypothetical protein
MRAQTRRDVIGIYQKRRARRRGKLASSWTDTGFSEMSERAVDRLPQIFRPNHAVMSGMDQGLLLRERHATLATSVMG